MSTPPHPGRSIPDCLTRSAAGPGRVLWGATGHVCLPRSVAAGLEAGPVPAGDSVLINPRDPLDAALALIDLDGLARRVVLCTPDLPGAHLSAMIDNCAVDSTV